MVFTDNKSALVVGMACHQTGDKPLPASVMGKLIAIVKFHEALYANMVTGVWWHLKCIQGRFQVYAQPMRYSITL